MAAAAAVCSRCLISVLVDVMKSQQVAIHTSKAQLGGYITVCTRESSNNIFSIIFPAIDICYFAL